MFGWAWGLAAWTFHVVAYILLNSSINSICHMIGYRNYDNMATNLATSAVLSMLFHCRIGGSRHIDHCC